MKLHINANIPSELTLDGAMEALHVQADDREEFAGVFRRCMNAARPKYCFAEADAAAEEGCARIGHCRFDSRILGVNLRGLNRAFPGVATCGREIHDLAAACDDLLVRFWVDGIAELRMNEAAAALRREIRQITGGQIRAMSPGSLGDFPLIEQEKLFSLLGGAPAQIGVELTPQCLMLPHKSTSAIYFESEQEYENCMLCLREGCFKRRAPFSEAAFLNRFGLTEADVRQRPGR